MEKDFSLKKVFRRNPKGAEHRRRLMAIQSSRPDTGLPAPSPQNTAILKNVFTWKKVAIVVVIIVVLAVIAASTYKKPPQHIRNEAALLLLQQIASVEIVMQTKCIYPPSIDAFTDGIDETAEIAIEKMAKLGFRPDPSVAFHIMRPPAIDGVPQQGFIAFAAHNSVGSTVYVCDYYVDTHGDIVKTEVREKSVHGNTTVTNSAFDLHCYKFNSSKKVDPVKKSSTPIQFAPDPSDNAPARMIVTVPAKY